jgi:hypothetical protein
MNLKERDSRSTRRRTFGRLGQKDELRVLASNFVLRNAVSVVGFDIVIKLVIADEHVEDSR